MSRPKQRPEIPYTNQQIVDAVHRHFYEEKHPQCSIRHGWGNQCLYDRTGCAVGCMLTQGDGDYWEGNCGGLSIQEVAMKYPSTFQVYFEMPSLDLLKALQRWHDDSTEFGDWQLFKTIVLEHNCVMP